MKSKRRGSRETKIRISISVTPRQRFQEFLNNSGKLALRRYKHLHCHQKCIGQWEFEYFQDVEFVHNIKTNWRENWQPLSSVCLTDQIGVKILPVAHNWPGKRQTHPYDWSSIKPHPFSFLMESSKKIMSESAVSDLKNPQQSVISLLFGTSV